MLAGQCIEDRAEQCMTAQVVLATKDLVVLVIEDPVEVVEVATLSVAIS